MATLKIQNNVVFLEGFSILKLKHTQVYNSIILFYANLL